MRSWSLWWWLKAASAVLVCKVAIMFAFFESVSRLPLSASGANILGIFTSPSPSHLIVHMSVVKALAERGHNVTVVSTRKTTVTHPNIRMIIFPPTEAQEETMSKQMSVQASKRNNLYTMIIDIFSSESVVVSMQFDIMKDKRFTQLYEMPPEGGRSRFDVVILGYFMNDFQLAAAARLDCPIILSWMVPSMEVIDAYVGNPREVAYVPNLNIPIEMGEPMGFVARTKNLFTSISFRLIAQAVEYYYMEGLYKQLIPSDGNLASYRQMKRNVSLVFCNSHFSEGPIRPNVPALVEIGGIQIKETPDALPQDIADFLSNSSQNGGTILFSLGSNLDGANINPEIIDIIYKTFSSLKQSVIWKWDQTLGGNASTNIIFKNWLPQDDILAHPNVRLFITHAGRGGFSEAKYHGVPMVALPVFGDQTYNADQIVVSGYGVKLDMLDLTEHNFKSAVLEVLGNPVYTENIKKSSRLYRDRPMSSRETVVFWTEYVIRHHGAAHMQSTLVHMNIIQSSNFDVVVSVCLAFYILFKMMSLSLRFICGVLIQKAKIRCTSDYQLKHKKQ